MVTQTIDCICPSQLTAEDARRWNELAALRPDLTGPYFDVRYVKAIAADVPHCGVARIHHDGVVVGYFPYQLRSRVMQPLGAPMSDYHGVIAAPETEIDFNALLRATGARRLEFQGWIGPPAPKASGILLRRRVADLSEGYDQWWAARNAEHHKFFKNIGRCQRNVEKDFGGFAFTWERVTPEVMDWVVALKREQYRKSAMHDVFGCGWTRKMLTDLAAYDDDHYGLRVGVFRHEGKIVAAEIGLMGSDEVHLWFPAYDPAYYRYSVGILLAVAIIKGVSAQGIKRFDFGTGGEEYKAPLTVEMGECMEGDYHSSYKLLSKIVDKATAVLPVARTKVDAARLSFRRRVSLIRATETDISGWGRASWDLAKRAWLRRPQRPAPKPAIAPSVVPIGTEAKTI